MILSARIPSKKMRIKIKTVVFFMLLVYVSAIPVAIISNGGIPLDVFTYAGWSCHLPAIAYSFRFVCPTS